MGAKCSIRSAAAGHFWSTTDTHSLTAKTCKDMRFVTRVASHLFPKLLSPEPVLSKLLAGTDVPLKRKRYPAEVAISTCISGAALQTQPKASFACRAETNTLSVLLFCQGSLTLQLGFRV